MGISSKTVVGYLPPTESIRKNSWIVLGTVLGVDIWRKDQKNAGDVSDVSFAIFIRFSVLFCRSSQRHYERINMRHLRISAEKRTWRQNPQRKNASKRERKPGKKTTTNMDDSYLDSWFTRALVFTEANHTSARENPKRSKKLLLGGVEQHPGAVPGFSRKCLGRTFHFFI